MISLGRAEIRFTVSDGRDLFDFWPRERERDPQSFSDRKGTVCSPARLEIGCRIRPVKSKDIVARPLRILAQRERCKAQRDGQLGTLDSRRERKARSDVTSEQPSFNSLSLFFFPLPSILQMGATCHAHTANSLAWRRGGGEGEREASKRLSPALRALSYRL